MGTMQVPSGVREAEPMQRHTSWRTGGIARFYAEPTSMHEAQALANWAREMEMPLIWVGRGTNLLVRETGFPGLIAAYRGQAWELEEKQDDDLVHLRIEAGATMTSLVRRVAAMGLAGLEWAEGLPGTVGGAVVGNAGCYGGDMAGSLVSAEVLGEALEVWPVEQMGYGYRTSVLKHGEAASEAARLTQDEQSSREWWPQPLLVVAATFRLLRSDPASLHSRMAAIAMQRKARTPAGSSCGSVFKNPPGDSAGRLIEQVGLKGFMLGGAIVSPLHANYIINTGQATATDILNLIRHVQQEVEQQTGIMLELEVRII